MQVLGEVGIDTQRFPLDTDPRALSDGFKRRLALAAQLIRGPGVLMLDEPLAGLDWEVRKELVSGSRPLRLSCSGLSYPQLPLPRLSWSGIWTSHLSTLHRAVLEPAPFLSCSLPFYSSASSRSTSFSPSFPYSSPHSKQGTVIVQPLTPLAHAWGLESPPAAF